MFFGDKMKQAERATFKRNRKKLIELAFDHLMHVSMETVQSLDAQIRQFAVKPDRIPDMIMDI